MDRKDRKAAEALAALDRFEEAAARMLDVTGGGAYVPEVAGLALDAVDAARACGADALIAALGDPATAVNALLDAVRVLAEARS